MLRLELGVIFVKTKTDTVSGSYTFYCQSRYFSDARECFPTKSITSQCIEIIIGFDLAGGISGQDHIAVGDADTTTIVLYDDE